jgi:hypothetical protein
VEVDVEITSVNCNNCGAPLEVGPKTNFVTCKHCGSHLAVKRTASTAYTELLEGLDRKTDAIAEKVDLVIRQNELERIDREWEAERRKYFWTDKHGQSHPPTVAGGIIMAVAGTLFGLFWVGSLLAVRSKSPEGFGPPAGLAVIGVAVIIAAVVFGALGVTKAQAYEAAKRQYEQRRAAAAREADKTPSPPPPA